MTGFFRHPKCAFPMREYRAVRFARLVGNRLTAPIHLMGPTGSVRGFCSPAKPFIYMKDLTVSGMDLVDRWDVLKSLTDIGTTFYKRLNKLGKVRAVKSA